MALRKFRLEMSCFDSTGFCGTVGFVGKVVAAPEGFPTVPTLVPTGVEVTGFPIGVEATGLATAVEAIGVEGFCIGGGGG